MVKHYWQVATHYSKLYPYEELKSYYYGPRLKWMKLIKDDTTTRKKRQSTNSSTRKIS